MSREYISCADTAALIRKSLKESFPGVKFSVRSSTYSGGASINVGWTDGPNAAQVEAVADVFSGAYFDGMTDYKGSTYALMDGKQVKFGADFIFCNRSSSDAAVQRAINQVCRAFAGNFAEKNIPVPTVAQFRSGDLRGVDLMDNGSDYWALDSLIRRAMGKASDRLAVDKSLTAGKVIYLGNDGYSQVGALSPELAES